MSEPMEVTVGMEAGFAGRPGGLAALRRLAAMGVTSIETYCKWSDVAPAQDRWDWSLYDRDLAALRAAGLRWVPFLIAGPWYATPEWFRAGPSSVYAQCLEHDRPTGTQSIWSPHLFAAVDGFLAEFAANYRPQDLESVLLGITGDYGEAIFPVVGNWPGEYHGHAGYWCGDPYARDDFRRWVRARHGDLRALERSWGQAPATWAALEPPLAPERAPSAAAWLDFVTWYRGAMTDWAARWLAAARRHLPATELYLCTGGDMVPQHGADFSEQCRIAAACGAGVRITNEGSDYVHNLMLTRLVASAGQHHGAFYGFEPAAAVDAVGVAARQYNATASGARQLHEYQNNLIHTRDDQALPRPGAGEAWERGRDQLVRRVPHPHVALLHSLPDLALRQAGIAGDALRLARCLRPLCDFAVLDDHLVAAGALVGLQAVFLAPARLWAPTVLECLHAFAASGGLVIAAGPVPSVLGALAAADLFGFGPATEELAGIAAVLPVPEAPLPTVAAVPRQHLARGFRGLDPACRPLLRLAHTPKTGGIPLAAWYRPWGRGAAVFYAGQLAQGEDWMASAGMPAAFVADLLAHLPPALGLPAVPLATTPGVYETETSAGWLAWNATDAPRPWRGRQLDPWAIGAGSNAISGSDGTE